MTPVGQAQPPWLTVIVDDYSRAIAGYAVGLDAPSAMQTALALRQAIWRKSDPAGTSAASRTSSTPTTAATSPPTTSNRSPPT